MEQMESYHQSLLYIFRLGELVIPEILRILIYVTESWLLVLFVILTLDTQVLYFSFLEIA